MFGIKTESFIVIGNALVVVAFHVPRQTTNVVGRRYLWIKPNNTDRKK